MTIITTPRIALVALALLCAAATSLAAPEARAAKPAAAAPVNLNTASAKEMRSLPGIGPRRSARIVAHRKAHGPFKSVDALADVPGISEKLVQRLRSRLTVGGPRRDGVAKRRRR